MTTTPNAASAGDTLRQILLIKIMVAKRKQKSLADQYDETAGDDAIADIEQAEMIAYEQATIDLATELLATIREIGITE